MGLGGNFLTQKLILERLDRSTFNPIIISPRDGAALEKYRDMSIPCEVLAPPKSLDKYGGAILRHNLFTKVNTCLDVLSYNYKLYKYLKKNKIDIVYTNCVRAQMSIGLGAILAGVPTTLYVKGELINPIIDRVCICTATKIMFFCQQNRDDRYQRLIKFFKHKVTILPIGMDLAKVRERRHQSEKAIQSEIGFDPAKVNTVVIAQLYRPKGQHLAIEAFGKIGDAYPNCHLYLLGDHVLEEYRSYKAELETLIEQRGLKGKVSFLGWREDSIDVVRLMDIVVHPSLAEGFGRAVLEAMALGKPVVASAVGGLREAILHSENGYLVQPGDVDGIERCWRKLIAEPELRSRLGVNARGTVEDRFQIDDKVFQIMELWSKLASKVS